MSGNAKPTPDKRTTETAGTGDRPASRGKWSGRIPWILLVVTVMLLAWLTVSFRSQVESETSLRRQAEAQAESFREQMTSLREQLAELEGEMQAIAESGNESAEAALRRQRELEQARKAQAQSEQEYNSTLERAEAQRDELAEQLAMMETEMAGLRQQLADARSTETELRDQIERAQRLSDALQTQLKGKEEALSALERSYQRFKDTAGSASRQLDIMSKTVSELQMINERRARQMEQAMRRMRELSENYRTVAVRIDSDPSTQGTLNAEVNRLQSSVLAVEDHLAQIATLNTQASALEQRLAKARSGAN